MDISLGFLHNIAYNLEDDPSSLLSETVLTVKVRLQLRANDMLEIAQLAKALLVYYSPPVETSEEMQTHLDFHIHGGQEPKG